MTMRMKDEIGVIHEVGDLGLGFEPLTEKEQKTLSEEEKRREKDDKK